MTPLDWAIAAGAVILIALTNWYFLGSRRAATATASQSGIVDVTVLVDGGYSPAEIEVPAGSRVRVTFDRREDNPCSDEIVIADFGIRRDLPAFRKTTIELTAIPGRHVFTCGMGMLHGALIAR